ncbi:MAG: lysylphosphatidylglycerol synthase domain-containing protein [Actinomycetota bacterium]|nr:lysylphosphatidylglycerol synthase domain-containing protein [Actinomycetota bacterium]
MRIAFVSPYSWTYPGGVTRHIEALAQQFIAEGHHVRVLAPYDPEDPVARLLHRGARPQPLPPPDYLVSLGRTVGIKANGAVSNLSVTALGMTRLHKALRTGGFDVIHVHEPVAPLAGWWATEWAQAPVVGTFHSYSESLVANGLASFFGARRVLNRLHVRIAVSEAAAWTAQRFFGGHYRVIPNGVQVDPEMLAAAGPRPPTDRLKIVFVGQSVERKGLPLLLRSFEALRDHIPTELTVIGPRPDELAPMMLDDRGVRVLGKVDDERKRQELARADILCAPSLRGESFGMVLTEAFAAGTPVVASDIAGYRDVVRDGVDGELVPRADPQALAETLRDLWEAPERRAAMAQAAAQDVQRFAWPRVAGEVMAAYEDAIATPKPSGAMSRVAVWTGVRASDLKPHVRARRMPSLEPPLPSRHGRVATLLRRGAMAGVSVAGIVLAILALNQIGLSNIASALINSSPTYVLAGLGAMCAAMVVRAVSWHAILRAALPAARVKLTDAMQGTFIGVLMSSTLPARLGEPSRALVVARRTGRPREDLPVVLGTLVSQTLLNIVALAVLGAVMFSSVDLFSGHQDALLLAALAPLALLVLVLLAPIILRRGTKDSQLGRIQKLLAQGRRGMMRVRTGLTVFRRPRLGATAAGAQFLAWGLQWLSCYLLLIALGLSHQAGIAAAAAVLFAVNITAVLPATPANLGIFQAACATVLHAGWHVGLGTGVAYGVILQAVEVSTALLMGAPALVKEGMSWREVRLRAMHAAPVKLPARPGRSQHREGSRVEA